MNASPGESKSWVLNRDAVIELLSTLSFRDQTINCVVQAIDAVNTRDEAPSFRTFCQNWPELINTQSPDQYPLEWHMLAVVAHFPDVIQKHRERNIPLAITRDTLYDFDRRMEESAQRFGEWKFRSPGWFRNHISGKFFQLGRLQYVPGAFGYPYQIYRPPNGHAIALANPGIPCSADGWPSRETTFNTALATKLNETPEGISGHPTRDNGSIATGQIQLPANSIRLTAVLRRCDRRWYFSSRIVKL